LFSKVFSRPGDRRARASLLGATALGVLASTCAALGFVLPGQAAPAPQTHAWVDTAVTAGTTSLDARDALGLCRSSGTAFARICATSYRALADEAETDLDELNSVPLPSRYTQIDAELRAGLALIDHGATAGDSNTVESGCVLLAVADTALMTADATG
jgi:hypothetical protein